MWSWHSRGRTDKNKVAIQRAIEKGQGSRTDQPWWVGRSGAPHHHVLQQGGIWAEPERVNKWTGAWRGSENSWGEVFSRRRPPPPPQTHWGCLYLVKESLGADRIHSLLQVRPCVFEAFTVQNKRNAYRWMNIKYGRSAAWSVQTQVMQTVVRGFHGPLFRARQPRTHSCGRRKMHRPLSKGLEMPMSTWNSKRGSGATGSRKYRQAGN